MRSSVHLHSQIFIGIWIWPSFISKCTAVLKWYSLKPRCDVHGVLSHLLFQIYMVRETFPWGLNSAGHESKCLSLAVVPCKYSVSDPRRQRRHTWALINSLSMYTCDIRSPPKNGIQVKVTSCASVWGRYWAEIADQCWASPPTSFLAVKLVI